MIPKDEFRDYRDAFQNRAVAHTLEVVDDASTTFRSEHRFEVEAKIRTRFFFRQFNWTGSGSINELAPELECDIDDWGFPTQKLHGPVISEEKSRIVLVDLGRTFSIGETAVIHFKHRLKDLKGTFQPYLGHAVRPGTEKLELSVILPPAIANAVRYEECSADTNKPLTTEPLTSAEVEGGRLMFTKSIDRPDPNRGERRITWNLQ